SVLYAFNVNIIKKHLQDLSALAIALGSFVILTIPSLAVLIYADFFSERVFNAPSLLPALGYLAILAVVGTGIAKVVFNKLVQLTTPVFASSVTYLIPIVALSWGLLDGERFTLFQLFAGLMIIGGVFLANLGRK
ncbi:MAG: DMT family transporter, partial [Flavobacteriaceae bacterium]|nr:DMT family transporter [Flavobacteriaceae bacterium]